MIVGLRIIEYIVLTNKEVLANERDKLNPLDEALIEKYELKKA